MLKNNKYILVIICGFLFLLIGSTVLLQENQGRSYSSPVYMANSLTSSASTNPAAPTVLSDDVLLYEFLVGSTYYYYKTSAAASNSYYHIVWLRPESNLDDADLELFNDSGYSSSLGASWLPAGETDWIIYRPSVSQYLYPRVYVYDMSFYTIEWEECFNSISLGSYQTGSLSASEAIQTHRVSLLNTSTYQFRLSVPSSADYDLYLYYLDPGQSGLPSSYVACSETVGFDVDEAIEKFKPSKSGQYALVVFQRNGSGTYYLYFENFVPPSLSDDNSVDYTYRSGQYHYWQTSTQASSTYYQTVWLKPDTSVSTDLYLYNDTTYTTLLESSTLSSSNLDWIVFRPAMTKKYYPAVWAGLTGGSYIEWEQGDSALAVRSEVSAYLEESDCLASFRITLSTDIQPYYFDLDVPTGADYDLYLYYMTPGEAKKGNTGYLAKSTTVGLGVDEAILNFTPSITGDYLIIVTRKSGEGWCDLSLYSFDELPNKLTSYNYFNASASSIYYFKTAVPAKDSCYNVLWVCPTNPANDYLLSVYAIKECSYNKLADSEHSYYPRQFDWLLFRPISGNSISPPGYYYCTMNINQSGYAYLRWENTSATLSTDGTSQSNTLTSTDRIHIYEVTLSSANKYDINLEVPTTGDFDLWFYLTTWGGVDPGDTYYYSSSAGLGVDESINRFSPSGYYTYAILVVQNSGSGTYSISVSIAPPLVIPAFEFIPFLIGLCIIGYLISTFKRAKNIFPF